MAKPYPSGLSCYATVYFFFPVNKPKPKPAAKAITVIIVIVSKTPVKSIPSSI